MENRIRELRSERSWTQAHLAEELGVSRQTINALEAGRWDPSLQLAFDLAALFGRRVEDVFVPGRHSASERLG